MNPEDPKGLLDQFGPAAAWTAAVLFGLAAAWKIFERPVAAVYRLVKTFLDMQGSLQKHRKEIKLLRDDLEARGKRADATREKLQSEVTRQGAIIERMTAELGAVRKQVDSGFNSVIDAIMKKYEDKAAETEE